MYGLWTVICSHGGGKISYFLMWTFSRELALQNHVWYKTHFGNVSVNMSAGLCLEYYAPPPWDFCQQLPYILKVFTRKAHRVDRNNDGPSMERVSHTLGLHRIPDFFTCVRLEHTIGFFASWSFFIFMVVAPTPTLQECLLIIKWGCAY